MASVIDKTDNYFIWDLLFVHCDEHQFKYQCKNCDEMMGCQFCEFDPYEKCECQYDLIDSGLFTTKEND